MLILAVVLSEKGSHKLYPLSVEIGNRQSDPCRCIRCIINDPGMEQQKNNGKHIYKECSQDPIVLQERWVIYDVEKQESKEGANFVIG